MAAPLKIWQRRMRLAGWSILVLLLSSIVAYVQNGRAKTLSYYEPPEPLEPGEAYGKADFIVSEVLFSAADIKLYAYRFGPEEPFRIMVLRPGQDGVEECVGGEAFDRWFFQTTEMYIGAALDDPVAAAPQDWAVFELISYESVLEENDTRLLLPTRPGEPIIVEWPGIPGQYPSEWDPELFALVKTGCAGLGAKPT